MALLFFSSHGYDSMTADYSHLNPRAFLLTWINLNPSMDTQYKVWDKITYPFSNFDPVTIEVLE